MNIYFRHSSPLGKGDTAPADFPKMFPKTDEISQKRISEEMGNCLKVLILLGFQHILFLKKNAFFIIFLSKIKENVFPDHDFHTLVSLL